MLPGELSGDILCLIAAMLYADAWLRDRLNERDDIIARQVRKVWLILSLKYMNTIPI